MTDRIQRRGRLRFAGRAAKLSDPAAFARLLDKLYCTDWNVYAKRPFAGTEKVFRYLGRYTRNRPVIPSRLPPSR